MTCNLMYVMHSECESVSGSWFENVLSIVIVAWAIWLVVTLIRELLS